MKATRRGREPAGARTALLEAGRELFALHGFDGTKVDRIAERAGVNKALISYHFGGKIGLYREIIAGAFGPLGSRLEEIAASPEPAEAAIRKMIETFAGLAREHPGFPPMILREILSEGRHLGPDLAPHLVRVFGSVRAIIARGNASGAFRPVDPLMTHLALTGSLMFFFATERFRAKLVEEARLPFPMPSSDDYVHHVEDLYLNGLRATGPTGERTKE